MYTKEEILEEVTEQNKKDAREAAEGDVDYDSVLAYIWMTGKFEDLEIDIISRLTATVLHAARCNEGDDPFVVSAEILQDVAEHTMGDTKN